MKVNLTLEFGDTTCAVEPGKFCEMIGTKSFGRREYCFMFGVNLHRTSPLGWVERCPECLKRWPPQSPNG